MTEATEGDIERIEKLRQDLHRMRNSGEIAAQVHDVGMRKRIQDIYAAEIPGGLAGKLDVTRTDGFGHLLVAIRFNLMRKDDYDAELRRFAHVLDEAIRAPAGASLAKPPSRPEPVGTTPGPEDVPPPPSREASDAPVVQDDEPPHEVTPDAEQIDDQPTSVVALRHFRQVDPVVEMRLFSDRPKTPAVFHPALLAPPPAPDCPSRQLTAWLSGEFLDQRGLRIRLEGIAERADTADLEVELRSDPASFLAANGIKPRLNTSAYIGYGDWLMEIAHAEGHEMNETHLQAVARSCERVIETFYPDHPGQLAALSAHLGIGDELAPCLAAAISLEEAFLQDGDPEEASFSRLHVQGSIHPDHALHEGIVLDHALASHFLAGFPLDATLAVSLVELRMAQAMRLQGDWNSAEPLLSFDKEFFTDCRQPLEQYMIDSEPMPEP